MDVQHFSIRFIQWNVVSLLRFMGKIALSMLSSQFIPHEHTNLPIYLSICMIFICERDAFNNGWVRILLRQLKCSTVKELSLSCCLCNEELRRDEKQNTFSKGVPGTNIFQFALEYSDRSTQCDVKCWTFFCRFTFNNKSNGIEFAILFFSWEINRL